MERPFEDEIAELENTHRWACETPIESLVEHVRELSTSTLLAVGSGGSLTTATMAVNLCRDFTSGLSFAFTPQELWSRRNMLRQATVFVATAGGSNPDAIGAMKMAAQHESKKVLALCTKIGSKLARESSKFSNTAVEEFALPYKGDGFLAVNSLWASSLLRNRSLPSALNGLA